MALLELGIPSKKKRVLARLEHELEGHDFQDRLESMFVHDDPSLEQSHRNLGIVALYTIYAVMGKEGIREFADWATHENMGIYPQQVKPMSDRIRPVFEDFAELSNIENRAETLNRDYQRQDAASAPTETRRDFILGRPLKCAVAMAAVSGLSSVTMPVSKPFHKSLPMVRIPLKADERASRVVNDGVNGAFTGYFAGRAIDVMDSNQQSAPGDHPSAMKFAAREVRAPLKLHEPGYGHRTADDIARYAADALQTFLHREQEQARHNPEASIR